MSQPKYVVAFRMLRAMTPRSMHDELDTVERVAVVAVPAVLAVLILASGFFPMFPPAVVQVLGLVTTGLLGMGFRPATLEATPSEDTDVAYLEES